MRYTNILFLFFVLFNSNCVIARPVDGHPYRNVQQVPLKVFITKVGENLARKLNPVFLRGFAVGHTLGTIFDSCMTQLIRACCCCHRYGKLDKKRE